MTLRSDACEALVDQDGTELITYHGSPRQNCEKSGILRSLLLGSSWGCSHGAFSEANSAETSLQLPVSEAFHSLKPMAKLHSQAWGSEVPSLQVEMSVSQSKGTLPKNAVVLSFQCPRVGHAHSVKEVETSPAKPGWPV